MIYLVAIFIPPLYFLIKKKWLGFVVSSLLLVLSFFLAMTVVLLPVALILWALCSAVAVWNLRKQLVHESAEVLATKMADKMRQAHPAAEPPRVSESKPMP
ncbi:MAG TPA: hypothetical protein VKV04_10870 [Verrucomicrobiae bacterium]|nr:hypothetical protein [Verrucomicrobiae bacterium]